MLKFTSATQHHTTPHHTYLTRELSHAVLSASAVRALDRSINQNINRSMNQNNETWTFAGKLGCSAWFVCDWLVNNLIGPIWLVCCKRSICTMIRQCFDREDWAVKCMVLQTTFICQPIDEIGSRLVSLISHKNLTTVWPTRKITCIFFIDRPYSYVLAKHTSGAIVNDLYYLLLYASIKVLLLIISPGKLS